MKRSCAIVVASMLGVLAFSAPVLASHSGETTINLRARAGDSEVDGVLVCLRQSGHREVCGQTEDGELWVDSLPHGAYLAWVEPPSGYDLTGITCVETSFDMAYPCKVRDNEVRLVIRKGVVAVNINFHLSAP
jgi:hypothetical protein